MELRGACIFGQSGGPTSVINASAFGVFSAALESGCITRVLGAAHGIKGVLSEQLYDISQEAGGEREISETEFWKNFALLFQVDQPLPTAVAEVLPNYLVSGIEKTGRLVLTLTICKSAESDWTYQIVSLNTPPFSI